MLTRLVINTATLSTFDLNNITNYRSLIVFLYTVILFVCGVIVRKIWSIKTIGKTIYNSFPNSLTKQWQIYDDWVIQTKKIFETIEALRQSEERFRVIFEAAAVGISHTDIDGRILRTNPKFCQIVGYEANELLSMRFQDITHPDDLLMELSLHQKLLKLEQNSYHIEKRYIRRDGTLVWIKLTVSVICDSNGKPIELIKVIEDISTHKQAEAELIQNEKMSSLGQLVAGVAHEINNPISFIYGNISHIHEYTQDLLKLISLYKQHYPKPSSCISKVVQAIDLDFIQEDLPKILSSMVKGADRIRQIVLSLRNFSRLDEASLKAVDIHEGIDSTLLILQSRLNRSSNVPKIEVVKQYGAIGKIECYAGQLNQVFMNILNNAIDAIYNLGSHQTGKIVINTNINEQNQVVINIIDNGCGMSEETRRRIYDPFFTTKPVGSGNGLAMAVSYKIIQKHGGKLECSSIVGEGTKFTILLPKQP